MLNSIRSRLMLWNIGIMGLLLIVFTLVLFLGLQQSFDLHERFILTDWINVIVDALQEGTAKRRLHRWIRKSGNYGCLSVMSSSPT